jgi:hypothetical protein
MIADKANQNGEANLALCVCVCRARTILLSGTRICRLNEAVRTVGVLTGIAQVYIGTHFSYFLLMCDL